MIGKEIPGLILCWIYYGIIKKIVLLDLIIIVWIKMKIAMNKSSKSKIIIIMSQFKLNLMIIRKKEYRKECKLYQMKQS